MTTIRSARARRALFCALLLAAPAAGHPAAQDETAPASAPGAAASAGSIDVGPPPTIADTSAMDGAVVALLGELIAGVRADPQSAEARAELGLAYEGNTIWSLAERCYDQALALAPEDNQWRFRRGVVRFYNGDADASLEDLRAAANAYKNTPVVQARLGDVLRTVGELDEAEAAWRQAITAEAKQPGEVRYAASRVGLAQVLLDLERADEAESLCRDALEIAPGYRHGHYTLGLALLDLGRDDEAAVELEQGKNAYPEFPPGPHGPKIAGYGRGYSRRMMLIENLVSAGQLDEASKRLEEVLAERPEEPMVLNLAARVALRRGDVPSAEALLEKSVAAAPDEPSTWIAKCLLELDQANRVSQQYVQMQQAMQLGQPIDPPQVEELRTRGATFGKDAVAAASKAVELAPMVGRNHYWLGVALQTSATFEGDPSSMGPMLQNALTSLQNALKLGCTEPSFNQQLATLYGQMGRSREMLRFSLRHLEQNPKDPNALSLAVQSLISNQKLDEVLPYVERLEAVSGGNVAALQFCVQAYLTVGALEPAERALGQFETAAAGNPQAAQFVTAVEQHIATERAKGATGGGSR